MQDLPGGEVSTDQGHRDRAIPAFLAYHYASPGLGFGETAAIEDAVALIEDTARLFGLTVTIEQPPEGS